MKGSCERRRGWKVPSTRPDACAAKYTPRSTKAARGHLPTSLSIALIAYVHRTSFDSPSTSRLARWRLRSLVKTVARIAMLSGAGGGLLMLLLLVHLLVLLLLLPLLQLPLLHCFCCW